MKTIMNIKCYKSTSSYFTRFRREEPWKCHAQACSYQACAEMCGAKSENGRKPCWGKKIQFSSNLSLDEI